MFRRTTTPEFIPGSNPPVKPPPEQTRVMTRYARWPSIAALMSGATPFVRDLTLPSGALAASEAWPHKGNDYQMLTTPDCARLYRVRLQGVRRNGQHLERIRHPC